MSGGAPGRPPHTLPPAIAAIGRRLPQWPHSVALAAALNLLARPRLSEDAARALAGRVVSLQVADAGIDARVRFAPGAFVPCRGSASADVTIRAAARDYALLVRREEDPDTLFFARRLAIEGDTALGLTVKNALDAVDWSPASVVAAVSGAARHLFGRRFQA